MKKYLILSLVVVNLLHADINNQTRKSEEKSESQREQLQRSIQDALNQTEQKSKGTEQSINKSLTNTLNKTRSHTKSITVSESGSWNLTINPIPLILNELMKNGWDKRAFFISNQDLNTDHFLGGASSGIIDLNKKAFIEASASARANMDQEQTRKLSELINLLHYTGSVIEYAIKNLDKAYDVNFMNIEDKIFDALLKATKTVKHKYIDIYTCSYGGSNDIYVCNNSEYTLALAQVGASVGIPSLLKFGNPYYSADKIAYITPSVNVSFAKNTSDAMSLLLQDAESRAVATAVRDYVQDLKQQGQTRTAQQIENAFVEKALSTSVSNNATATIQAINSGSPLSVLKIFQ